MGLGSFLKKFALPIAGIAAMPFTGGASSILTKLGMAGSLAGKIGTAAKVGGALSSVLGGASKARGQAQQVAEGAQLDRDRLTLEGKKFNLTAPRSRLANATRASAVANYKRPAPMTHARANIVSYNSPFSNPAMFEDPRMKQLSNAQLDDQLQAVLGKRDTFTPAGPPKSGFVDKALGVGSFGSSILGGLDKLGLFNRKRPVYDSPRLRPPVDLLE